MNENVKKKLPLIIIISAILIGAVILGIVLTRPKASVTLEKRINEARVKDKYLTFDDLVDQLFDVDKTLEQENSCYLVNKETFALSVVTFNYEQFDLELDTAIKDIEGNSYTISDKSIINYDKQYLQIQLISNKETYYILGTSSEAVSTINDIITVKDLNNDKVPDNETLEVKGTLLEQNIITAIVTDSIYYYYDEYLKNRGEFLYEYITNGNMHYYFDIDLNKKYLYNDYFKKVVAPYKEDGTINLYDQFGLNTKSKAVIIPGTIKVANNAFNDCQNITSVYLTISVETIGIGAFKNCKIDKILLPPHLKEIDKEAFSGCSFPLINLPRSISKTANEAFIGLDPTLKIYASHEAANIPSEVKGITLYSVRYSVSYDTYRKALEYANLK